MRSVDTGDDLGLLLATEQRLERALAAIRDEADRVRAAAVEDAARADAEAEASLAGARQQLTEQLAAENATRLAAIEADARVEVERWQRLREEVLAQEARRLARRLVELAAEGP